MTATRCPACAARLRPGDAWCGQCHTDLRPRPPEPVAVPRTAAPDGVPPGPDGAPATRRQGRRAAGPPSDGPTRTVDPEEAEALAREWAERLAASEAGAGLPGLAARASGRGGKVVLAVGVGLGFGAFLLLLMTGVGALL